MLGFVVVATSLAAAASASLIERVHWSTRDPRFFPGSHGVILYPQMGDRIDLICPVMSSSPFSSSSSSSSSSSLSSSSQSSASLPRRQWPQWSDSPVADSGSGLGLGLGFGPSPDFGTGPGLGSDLGLGPGPFLGMDPAVASGPGPGSGPGLGVGSGPGLGTGPGLGFGPSPGLGVNLDLSTGPAQRSGGIPALASGPGPNWGHVPGPDLGLDLSLDLGVAAAGGGFGPGSRPILGHGTGPGPDSGQGLGPGPAEFHRLYLVSRDSSVRCEAPPGARNSRLVLACDRPARALKYTLKVQRVSPNYRGLEFAPKREYHIISTSDGTWEGLSGRVGGACVTHGMRLVLRVGLDPRDEERARGIMGGAAWQDGKTTRHHGRAMTSDPTQGKSRDWNASDLRDVTSTAQVPHPAYPGPLLIGWLAAGSALVLLISLVGLSITWPHLRRHRAPQSTGRRQDSSSRRRRRRARSGARTGGGDDDEDEAEEETEEDGGVRGGGSGGGGGGGGGVAVAPGGSPCGGGAGAPCPHYGKVSGDYGLPLYIVPDLARQHAASVYYQGSETLQAAQAGRDV
ncbi:uncharacterized protein LOC116944586 [Petromyzon marinus]|uniref:uncharacterized protein LOC116944586 n=1 Tax=Petromyzon marinus TaxID=7757 RepID=UPI003F7027E0